MTELHTPAPSETLDGRGEAPVPQRRSTDRTPLGLIISEFERAYGTGRFDRLAELIEEHPLACWYGLQPDRLAQMVRAVHGAGIAPGIFLRVLTLLFAGAETGEFTPEAFEAMEADAEPSALPIAASFAGRWFTLRLEGRPVEAMQHMSLGEQPATMIRPVFDPQGGWELFGSVQRGFTAMLAGDFTTALSQLTRARLHVLVPSLAFLTRDACAKSAVLEALYGSAETARARLDEASRVPRTESWAEGLIDAHVAIAEALVSVTDPEEGRRMLAAIPLREVGEIWPFYVAALHRVHLAIDDQIAGRRMVEMFEEAPLPRVSGQGYSGSALPLVRAWDAILAGDLSEAREQIARADADIVTTKIVAARLELAAGRPREALALLEGQHEHTSPLRLLDLLRLAVIAGAHLISGSTAECRAVLEYTLSLPARLSADEAQFFATDVQRFAAAEVEGWPLAASEVGELDVLTGVSLTERELEVMRELVGGRSREEIARGQYISLNTLKAHLRSIYRKLGVKSRAAAVLEAERRGLV